MNTNDVVTEDVHPIYWFNCCRALKEELIISCLLLIGKKKKFQKEIKVWLKLMRSEIQLKVERYI